MIGVAGESLVDLLVREDGFVVEVGPRTAGRAGADPPHLAELRGVAPGW